MTSLNDFIVVDDVTDNLASKHNRLLGGIMRAEFVNTETITATKELTDDDCQFQIITPSGADRTVELSPEATTNHVTIIYNASGTYNVPVKDDSGATTYITLLPGKWALFLPYLNSAWKLAGSSYSVSSYATPSLVSTRIEGLTLTWNSATSIDIGVGWCYAENGDLIDVTSAITKGSLSLSASTWYHVYVYLSSGSPAAEVVTTAPVAWKGTAYSKTGDTSRRYVGSILSDGSGNVRNFVHNQFANSIQYRLFASDASPHRALSGGTATTATAVALSSIIPVTALSTFIRFTNLADKTVYTSEDNGVGVTQNTVALTAGNTATQSAFLNHLVDSSQQIWYKFASAVGAGAAYLDVLGYWFKR